MWYLFIYLQRYKKWRKIYQKRVKFISLSQTNFTFLHLPFFLTKVSGTEGDSSFV